VKCPLCGRDSKSFPRRPEKDETGVSCERCGDFYIDGLLTAKGPPADDDGRAILSGYVKWAKIEEGVPVEITAFNVDKIIERHKGISPNDKVDLILLYYSKVNPKMGHKILFDLALDIPIIYSADGNEFYFLLLDLAVNKFGYLTSNAPRFSRRGFIRITELGWERIERLKRVGLANDKYKILNEKIDKETSLRIATAKEKAVVSGSRYSSGLARQIGDIILESVKSELEQKLKTDKEIIFGVEFVSDPDVVNFLSQRIRGFWEGKKESVLKLLKDNFKGCHGMSLFESAKEEFLREVENEIMSLLIDLKTGEVRKDRVQREEKKVSDEIKAPDPKRVYVVHGRNEKAKTAMFAFLRAVGLDPIEWDEAVMQTKKGAPYVGEILDEAFDMAQAIVVMLTGDDVACMRKEYIKGDEPWYEKILTPQARTNVIFEAGRAFGTHKDRTILVELEKERTRPFSDIGGRHVVRISNFAEKRKILVDRLKTAGCEFSIDGRTEWMSTGDFDGAALNVESNQKGSSDNKKL